MKIKIIATSVVILFFITTATALASYGTEHIAKGNLTGGAKAKYWVSGDTTYGYTSHIKNSILNWNERSSRVSLSETTDASKADIKVYFGHGNLENRLGNSTLGATDYWKYNIFGQATMVTPPEVDNGTNFDKARIRLDNKAFKANSFSKYGEVVKVVGHEFGHSLSLNHFEDGSPHSKSSWMHSAKTDSPYPSSEDGIHLRKKWGD